MLGPEHVACSEMTCGTQASSGSWQASVVTDLSEVIANSSVNAKYRHLVVRCHNRAILDARPGQFFQLLCPPSAGGQPFLRRPMSLYATTPAQHRIEFLYKVTGIGTQGLSTLKAGDHLDIMGPLGIGFSLDAKWRRIVIVGRGVGLATLAPLADMARASGISVTAVLSARSPELAVCAHRFLMYGAELVTVTDSEGTSGLAGVERILRKLIAEDKCDAFFTCGSSRLLRLQQRLAAEFGVPGQVALEQQMACGIGLCHCCVRNFVVDGRIQSRRVCWDGPVFDLTEALP